MAVRAKRPHTPLVSERIVLLVGHGTPPPDYPRDKVARLKALEGQRRARGEPMTAQERELDAEIRAWPRTDASDPYGVGVRRLADALAVLVPVPVRVAYNEFAGPSIATAVDDAVRSGTRRIDVLPTMLTPGGVHSEVEIPEEIAAAKRRHPALDIRYAWPVRTERVAALLAEHLDP